MAILLTRTIVVQVWLFVYTVVVALVAPWGMAVTGLLLFIGLAVAAVALRDRNTFHPLIADEPPTLDVQPPSITPSRGPSLLRNLSWPNSGFHNIGRGTKGG